MPPGKNLMRNDRITIMFVAFEGDPIIMRWGSCSKVTKGKLKADGFPVLKFLSWGSARSGGSAYVALVSGDAPNGIQGPREFGLGIRDKSFALHA